ncbi:ArdC family protein [Cysteiniphilum halobium]|uniref:ArdC family protein n=1 Tax=Cysteiniphilum halobium TaxID=2219059 RepID=UPI0013C2BDF9|nr:zincin-like metallopeptidase domain-containing protein [Cysteiniphilum halobium]
MTKQNTIKNKHNNGNKQTYNDFVNEIAQSIKAIIQNGGATWKDVFHREGCAKLPVNAKGNLYSGVNVLNLYMAQLKNNYKSNQWLTFKQIKALNGSVNKGEKSSRVFFFTSYDKEKVAKEDFNTGDRVIKKGDAYETTILCPKYYAVFNLSQTTLAETENTIFFNDDLQAIIDAQDVEIITHDQGQAYYMPSLDIIKMPSSKYFDSEENYKAVLLHELAHSTMHKKRLNRSVDLKCKLSYAKEELVAELSSAMLSAHFGIKTDLQNHASYIDNWLTNLTDEDFNEAVRQSTKVLNYLLGAILKAVGEDNNNTEKVA